MCIASFFGNVLCFDVSEATVIRAAGKGVSAIKLKEGDRVFAAELATNPDSGPVVGTADGREAIVRPAKYRGSRGDTGKLPLRGTRLAVWKRGPDVRLDGRVTEGEA